MEFAVLTPERQQAQLNDRLLGLESEYFNHSVNLQIAEAAAATDPTRDQLIQLSQSAMATIDAAHAVVVQQLDTVTAEIAANTTQEVPVAPA